jgi:hypothetical protein
MLPKKSLFKILAGYLAIATVLLSIPAQGWAMFIPAGGAAAIRKADMAAIQKTVESTVVKQRLMDYGLSPDEAMARVNTLSDAQVHQFAAQLNSLQAGADGVDALIFILLVAIIVVLILELSGHRVIVR